MNTKDFNSLKQKAYTAYHQDGILDLVFAVILLGFGTFMLTESAVFLALGAIIAALYIPLKQLITVPRFGFVRFESKKTSLVKAWFLMGTGVLVFLLIFFARYFISDTAFSPEFQTMIQRYHMVPLAGMLFGLPALAAAIFLKLLRFFLYAGLTLVLTALGALLELQTYLPIMSLGGLVLTISFILMIRFRKQYPLNSEGENE